LLATTDSDEESAGRVGKGTGVSPPVCFQAPPPLLAGPEFPKAAIGEIKGGRMNDPKHWVSGLDQGHIDGELVCSFHKLLRAVKRIDQPKLTTAIEGGTDRAF